MKILVRFVAVFLLLSGVIFSQTNSSIDYSVYNATILQRSDNKTVDIEDLNLTVRATNIQLLILQTGAIWTFTSDPIFPTSEKNKFYVNAIDKQNGSCRIWFKGISHEYIVIAIEYSDYIIAYDAYRK